MRDHPTGKGPMSPRLIARAISSAIDRQEDTHSCRNPSTWFMKYSVKPQVITVT